MCIREIGFRSEEVFGDGYRDAASVMAHEVFELGNSDILETLTSSFLSHLAKVCRLAVALVGSC